MDHENFSALVGPSFEGVADHSHGAIVPVSYQGGDYRLARDLEQVHLVMGFDGLSYGDDEYYPLAVMSTLLGGGMSSRLFQEVREKRGLAYSVYTFASNYEDGGLFGIYAGTGEDDAAELVPVVCGEIHNICAEVNDAEMARARAQLKASTLMSLESTSSRCETAARQLQVFDRTIPIAEVIEKIDAVDVAAVKNVARRVFASPPTIAALGPIGKLEEYDRIQARLSN